MDPFHFIIQMSLDFLSFSFSPFVQEFPYLTAVGTAESPVFIPSVICLLKGVQVIFLLVECLS